jgi:6-pyruvoyltetrahydropterin/6-carboxytetrahydropterin synthase
MIICRRFKFDAAHKLPDHQGKCQRLHGHTWHIDIGLQGPIQETGSAKGMVLDFGNLKKIVEKEIIEKFDHHYLNEVISFVPTAENLAMFISDTLNDAFVNSSAEVSFVRVWETEDAYAEYRNS